MKNISNGYGSDYIVMQTNDVKDDRQKILTNIFILEPMQDRLALPAIEAYCAALQPSQDKIELEQFIETVRKHWQEVGE